MTVQLPKEAELLPCPFCSGNADWHEAAGNASSMDDVNAGGVWIECGRCGASTNMRYSLMEDCRPLLLEQWNRRAALPAEPARVLTDAQIRKGWQDTFSTENPFCPCDLKSFTKAVNWAQRAIEAATQGAKA